MIFGSIISSWDSSLRKHDQILFYINFNLDRRHRYIFNCGSLKEIPYPIGLKAIGRIAPFGLTPQPKI